MEKTLVLLKPDCVQRRLMGRMITRFEDKGLKARVTEESEAVMPAGAPIGSGPSAPCAQRVLRSMRSAPLRLIFASKSAISLF